MTFVTNAPGVLVSLVRRGGAAKPLAETRADNKLNWKLPAGKHVIQLSHAGYTGKLQKEISVQRDGANTITLNYPVRPAAPPAVAVARPTPTPPPPTPPPAVRPEMVVARLTSPRETDVVGVGDLEQALPLARAEAERRPSDPQLRARALLIEGRLAYLRGDYDRALSALKDATTAGPAVAPESWLIAYGLGNAYFAKRLIAEAAAEYGRAARLSPQFGAAHKGLGDVRSKQRESLSALKSYEEAVRYGYVTDDLAFSRAYQQARLSMSKDHRRALGELQIVRDLMDAPGAKVRPDLRADLLTDMGDCHVALKQKAQARDNYKRAVAGDPDNAWARYRFGEALFKEGAYAEAADQLQHAIQLFTHYHQERDREYLKQATQLKAKADKKLSERK